MVHRCKWATNDRLIEYHDREWGVPVHDDVRLFEFLVLEGAQAGLSWDTILRKREAYRVAFAGFDPHRVAQFSEDDLERILQDPGIVRNRLKVQSAVVNAKRFIEVQQEWGSFDAYVWRFVGHKPIVNAWNADSTIPVTTPEAHALSRDLRKRGFKFVGPTICYSFMQAVGMVNDHLVECFRYSEIGVEADA